MPILAIRNHDDVKRLRAQVRGRFESDLLDTLESWRFRYRAIFETIRYAADVGLQDCEQYPPDSSSVGMTGSNGSKNSNKEGE
jgi:hypothetical protein